MREEAPRCLIHVFGCGNPDLIPELIEAGADSFDSSSYIRKAADKAGSGSGMHTGMYEAVKRLYLIEDVIKKVKGQYKDTLLPCPYAGIQGDASTRQLKTEYKTEEKGESYEQIRSKVCAERY